MNRKDFKNFREECLRFQRKWGLQHWDLFFEFEDEPVFVNNLICAENRTAKIVLSKNSTKVSMREFAKHEMIHILLADKLGRLSNYKYVTQNDILEKEEELVKKLTSLIK